MARAAVLVWLATGAGVAGCSGPEEEATASTVALTPLAQRPSVAGPRFARLPATETGLVFRNELRRENTVAYV